MYVSEARILTNVYVDLGYKGKEFAQDVLQRYGVKITTVAWRATIAFMLEARRWVVERTFAWIGKARRLSNDYELSPVGM